MSLAPIDLLRLTCRALYGNLLRSSLTTVGVFMGVTAVTATLQVGSISRAVIAQQLAERDAPQVKIYPQWVPGSPQQIQFSPAELTFLQQRLTGLHSISSVTWVRSELTIFQDQEAYPTILAVTQGYLSTTGRRIKAGRFFSPNDYESYQPVTVIDEQLADHLFENVSSDQSEQAVVGKRIYVNRQPFVVIGVVESSLEDDDNPADGSLLISTSIYRALWGQQQARLINLRPQRIDHLESLGEQAEQLLMKRFPGHEFWVWNNVGDILEQQATLQLASRALAVVGAISLLVGGVGIANIMVASVAERVPEIGIRRAVGATQREILVQFILEAVLLSLVGGLCAIATVHSLTKVVAQRFELPYQFEPQLAGLALGSAIAVGIGASFVPALQASRLDPVQALRSD